MTTKEEYEAVHRSIQETLERCNNTIASCAKTRKECTERAEQAGKELEEGWTKFNEGFVKLQVAMLRKLSTMNRSVLSPEEEMSMSEEEQRAAMLIEKTEKISDVKAKVDQLAEYVLASKNFVVWTGAGISTNSGIPDFRGPDGKWTQIDEKRYNKTIGTKSIDAFPTTTHRALLALLRKGHLKKIISSNTDGLHLRSGIHPDDLAELHGNSNKLRCDQCHRYYFMDKNVRVAPKAKLHDTAYKCLEPECGGTLCDTIINFGEILHPETSDKAAAIADDVDLVLVLGSSLRVITCHALEKVRENGGKLVIVNKQRTAYDDDAALRVYADCDVVTTLLANKLRVTIPEALLVRYATLHRSADGTTISYSGETVDGNCYSYVHSLEVVPVPVAVAVAAPTTRKPSRTPAPGGRRAAPSAPAPPAATAAAAAATATPLQGEELKPLEVVIPEQLATATAAGGTTATTTRCRASTFDLRVAFRPSRCEPPCLIPFRYLPAPNEKSVLQLTLSYASQSWSVSLRE